MGTTAATQVLVVDDEPELRTLLGEYFGRHGFVVRAAEDAAQARLMVAQERPALALLDVNMPGENGLSLARWLREAHPGVGLVMLTTAGEAIDRIVGLELGADDYIAKPFSPRELVARVRGILRRSVRPAPAAQTRPILETVPNKTPFALDEERRQIRFYSRVLELSRYEYGILRLLVQKPGRVFTRDELFDKVWLEGSGSLDRTIDAHIKTLRAKLKAVAPHTEPIRTSRGAGYALSEELPAA